jgi:hypothetical protein
MILNDYNQFNGRHWETGSVANYLAYHGVKAPHTGKPYSEAFLLGVSGGVVMGYFSFDYKGYDPSTRILTRNTFDPLDTMLSRLGVVQHRQQTGSAVRGVQNLLEALAEGNPAIVWADHFSLPYTANDFDEQMWAMFPILVYGYDEAANQVWIADRARVPLMIGTDTLGVARGRVKKDKNRLLTIDPPDPNKLSAAVQAGIWDCINLYTEKPPKGSANNFGLRAFQHWQKLLTKPRTRGSWAQVFPHGREMVAGLLSTYGDIMHFGKDSPAERNVYADFLEEAALLLDRPDLKGVAGKFRATVPAWEALCTALLPDDVSPFRAIKTLTDENHYLFLNQGGAATVQIRANKQAIAELLAQMETEFPLDDMAVTAMRENIAAHVAKVHDLEAEAVTDLKRVMS